jgi:hypothetical protein
MSAKETVRSVVETLNPPPLILVNVVKGLYVVVKVIGDGNGEVVCGPGSKKTCEKYLADQRRA